MTRLRFTYTFEVDPRSRTARNLQAKEVSREDEGVAMALIVSIRDHLDDGVRQLSDFEFSGSSTLEGPL